jgi:hypothetical protein
MQSEGERTLEDLFQELEEAEGPEYSIKSGEVYDTVRFGPHEIPLSDINSMATDLNQGEVESAYDTVSEYLDPGSTEI